MTTCNHFPPTSKQSILNLATILISVPASNPKTRRSGLISLMPVYMQPRLRQPFFDALTPRDVTGGLLGRFLIFTPAERYPRRNVDRRRDDLPASVAKCIAFWSRLANLTHSGDFLPHEDDAINHLEEFGDQMRAEMISAKPSEQPLAAVVGRAAEHAAKLALIAAAATSDSDPITLKQSEWATAVAEHSARTLQESGSTSRLTEPVRSQLQVDPKSDRRLWRHCFPR